jgi:quinol monooxygenase YgiN/catechol 2,3-dioxygenase-like lactoylglutathione lyase family enzyme
VTDLPLRGKFHHAAVVVSDLDRAVEFYTRLFGGEVELISGVEGEAMASLHALPSAHFDLAFLHCRDAIIELFQFHDPTPEPGSRPPAANQIGSAHIAFEVDDVFAAYERLVAEGVEFSRPPHEETEGDAAGYVLSFLYDPDGNRVELIAPPRAAAPAERPAVVVALKVSEHGRERFLDLIGAVKDATHAEPGAEEWTLHQGAGDPNSFVIYERYRDIAALEEHHHQPALQCLLAELTPLLAEPPQMTDLRTVEVD